MSLTSKPSGNRDPQQRHELPMSQHRQAKEKEHNQNFSSPCQCIAAKIELAKTKGKFGHRKCQDCFPPHKRRPPRSQFIPKPCSPVQKSKIEKNIYSKNINRRRNGFTRRSGTGSQSRCSPLASRACWKRGRCTAGQRSRRRRTRRWKCTCQHGRCDHD